MSAIERFIRQVPKHKPVAANDTPCTGGGRVKKKSKLIAAAAATGLMTLASIPAAASCVVNLTVHNTYPDKAVQLGVCLTKAQHVHAWGEDVDCMAESRHKEIKAGESSSYSVNVLRTKRTYFSFKMKYYVDFEGGYKTEEWREAFSNTQKSSVSRDFNIFLKPTDKTLKPVP